MLGAVAIAPAIEAGVALTLLVTLVVALGLLAVHRGIITPALLGLANLLDAISIPIPRHRVHIFGPVSAACRWAVHEGDHALSALVLTSERGAVWLFHVLAQQAKWLGNLLGDIAETMEHGFARILFLFPPAAALWLAVRTAQQVAKLPGRVDALVHRVGRDLPREIAAAKAAVLAALAVVAHRAAVAWHAGTVTLPHRIDRIGDGVRWIGRTMRQMRAHLRKLAWLTAFAGPAALVATGLGRLGLSWVRCGKVNKVGKKLCGINNGLFDFAMGTTTLFLVLTDLCALIKLMQAAAIQFEAALIAFVNEVQGHVCGGREAAPSGLVESDWQPVSRLPSGLVAADLGR